MIINTWKKLGRNVGNPILGVLSVLLLLSYPCCLQCYDCAMSGAEKQLLTWGFEKEARLLQC